ncbi:hypothetical protein EWM62_05235 [Mucilaginibacter terrigena]|uniref:DUF4365 domain-containing protein n=1 Tax=Mucilaginibacter terrigena TaxID=2492395 RepID=A0A4Q5LPM5_9SPHI|nr:hypothetical protein [Mucilaginibacter terrigena]RYU91345.1 hypothetical protein EWM62_05235 [Mucilaginibacter terrigena]
MESKTKIKEWRAEEIAKIFLLKSEYGLAVERFSTKLFDYFVQLRKNELIRFAVEVKTRDGFVPKMREQLPSIKIYQNNGMINIPVLLFRIDEVKETGEIAYLVEPVYGKNYLMIKEDFDFIKLDQANLSLKIEEIKEWYLQLTN